MDTPELPWSEVMAAKSSAEKEGKAYICPGVCEPRGLMMTAFCVSTRSHARTTCTFVTRLSEALQKTLTYVLRVL